MTNILTQADLLKLQTYADSGDRYDYWSLLASLGDKYAELALQVVTGSTLFGYIANNYAASYAPAGGALADAENTQVWWEVGVQLMQADLNARTTAISQLQNPLNLSFQTIQGYHQQVFAANGLPPEAWTPYVPLESYITTGNWTYANVQWQAAISSGTALTTLQNLENLANGVVTNGGATAAQVATWLTTVGAATLAYGTALGQVGGNAARISLRNADYIL